MKEMNETSEISERIRGIIMNNFPLGRHRTIMSHESILGSGLIDSMGILELVEHIEGEFKIIVSEEDLLPEHFETIASLTAFVERKVNNDSSGTL